MGGRMRAALALGLGVILCALAGVSAGEEKFLIMCKNGVVAKGTGENPHTVAVLHDAGITLEHFTGGSCNYTGNACYWVSTTGDLWRYTAVGEVVEKLGAVDPGVKLWSLAFNDHVAVIPSMSGKVWTAASPDGPYTNALNTTGGMFTAVCTRTSCWVAGDDATIIEYDVLTGTWGSERVIGVMRIRAAAYWENGETSVLVFAGTQYVHYSFDEGVTWTTRKQVLNSRLRMVDIFSDATNPRGYGLFAGGQVDNRVIHATNLSAPLPSYPTAAAVKGVFCFPNASSCLVAEEGGFYERYSDGALTSITTPVMEDMFGEILALSVCGDGLREGHEICDPGSTFDNVCPLYNTSCLVCGHTCHYRHAGVVRVCGDGVVDAGFEECDDGVGNSDSVADACRLDCTFPVCGDGVVDGGEECDSGAGNSDAVANACRTDCTLPVCGDGVVDSGESCDNGTNNSNTLPDTCRLNCTLPTCGDGVVDAGEVCDSGSSNSDTLADACRVNCTAAGCGDGVVDSGEVCDNAGANSNTAPDACRLNCALPACGDGVVDSDESCDNGTSNSNTASNTCRVNCTLPMCGDGVVDTDDGECDSGSSNSDTNPDTCRTNCTLPTCGDGVVDSGEECDNGTANSNTAPNTCRLDCSLPVCGDGVVDSGEACDNGTTNSNTTPDACRLNCSLPVCGDSVVDSGESCDAGASNSDTTPNACRSSCVSAYCGDGVLDSSESCDNGTHNSNTVPGACRLNCALASCGNGVVDAGEECDSGAANNNSVPDACRATCVAAHCGDGVVDGGEECDSGGSNSNIAPDTCRANCTLPTCGDGVVDSGESCDSGSGNSDTAADACRTDCSAPACGDGVVDRGEECDSGTANSNINANACRLNCSAPTCGDGIVDSGEECDSGSANSDTLAGACRTSCVSAHCGDGVVDAGEVCDSGASNSDGAANACRSTCVLPVCGDGVVDSGEECDDGASNNNNTAPDACRTNCTLPTCGDGVVGSDEDCDDDGLCCSACSFVPALTVCRAKAGGCDIADTCTGYSSDCDDRLQSGGTVCRAASGQCDVPEVCDGVSAACPTDVVAAVSVGCSDGDICTGPADYCNGSIAVCESGGDMCSCSDGYVAAGAEACDDGNALSGDGCSGNCSIEAGWVCPSAGSACTYIDCSSSGGVADCHGDCDGTAAVDSCGVCAGGNTGVTPNIDVDSCGVCFGNNSAVDGCGVCFGGNADYDACGVCFGDNTTCAGCDGVPNSGAVVDVCGVCGGDSSSCLGCDGVPIPLGGKHYDLCGNCGGSETVCFFGCDGVFNSGVYVDCAGVCNGTAELDSCGVCAGGNTSVVAESHRDSCGICFGTCGACGSTFDVCGICGGGGSSCVGCDGVPIADGGKIYDICGECGGNGTSCEAGCDGVRGSGVEFDCNGVCGGTAELNNCSMCTGGDTGRPFDTGIDDCGVCFGGNTAKDSCGVCYGVDSRDSCGVCFGGDAAVDDCGICYGNNRDMNLCGVCGTSTLDCLGCDSVPHSGRTVDSCGVCGGSGKCAEDVGEGQVRGDATVVPFLSGTVLTGFAIGAGGVVLGLAVMGWLWVRSRRKVIVSKFLKKEESKALANAPRGLVAFVTTDVQDSTVLWEGWPKLMAAALESHDAVMRATLAKHGGYEVRTEGDAFIMAFHSAADAVGFCVELQIEMLNADVDEQLIAEAASCAAVPLPTPDTTRVIPLSTSSLSDEGELSRSNASSSVSGTVLAAPALDALDGGSGECGSSRRGVEWLWRGLRVRMGIHLGEIEPVVDPRTQQASYDGPLLMAAGHVGDAGTGGQILISLPALETLPLDYASYYGVQETDLGVYKFTKGGEPVQLFEITPWELRGRSFGPIRAMSWTGEVPLSKRGWTNDAGYTVNTNRKRGRVSTFRGGGGDGGNELVVSSFFDSDDDAEVGFESSLELADSTYRSHGPFTSSMLSINLSSGSSPRSPGRVGGLMSSSTSDHCESPMTPNTAMTPMSPMRILGQLSSGGESGDGAETGCTSGGLSSTEFSFTSEAAAWQRKPRSLNRRYSLSQSTAAVTPLESGESSPGYFLSASARSPRSPKLKPAASSTGVLGFRERHFSIDTGNTLGLGASRASPSLGRRGSEPLSRTAARRGSAGASPTGFKFAVPVAADTSPRPPRPPRRRRRSDAPGLARLVSPTSPTIPEHSGGGEESWQ